MQTSKDEADRRQILMRTGLGITSAAAFAQAFGQSAAAALVKDGADAAPETVVVTAQRSKLDPLPEAILNIPQSINVVPAQVIHEQGQWLMSRYSAETRRRASSSRLRVRTVGAATR